MPRRIRRAPSAVSPSCRTGSVPTAATTRVDRLSKPSSGPALDTLGVTAEAAGLIETALTHRSFAFEQQDPVPHNERLEFLGDAILGAIVTAHIFNTYPDLTEGEMARLRASVVNTTALAEIARSLDLGRHIRLGKGEEASGGGDKPSLLADTFEAVVGAAYIERGLEAVTAFVTEIFAPLITRVHDSGGGFDPKTELQERVVRTHGELPMYRIASSGPEHDKRFIAHAYAGDVLLGVGRGRSKKEAEQEAAREALEKIGHVAPRGGGETSARAS
jgi:ribonuclease III